MRYQLHYETKDGKRRYYGEYLTVTDAMIYFELLWVQGDGKVKPGDISKVEMTILAKDQ